jgi:hypothetical protein
LENLKYEYYVFENKELHVVHSQANGTNKCMIILIYTHMVDYDKGQKQRHVAEMDMSR